MAANGSPLALKHLSRRNKRMFKQNKAAAKLGSNFVFEIKERQQLWKEGSGCGTVGRAVPSNTTGRGFESSHQQLLLNIYLLLTDCRKDEK